MLFDNNSFFGDLDVFCEENTNFFTNTNPKTILGKNLVLNFLGEIEFEIRTLGFSNKANEIANFYENCKTTTGIISFFANPVIKMILQEIQYMPTIRTYLKNRIFDDIENDKIQSLDNIFNNNETIYQENINKNQEYLKAKILKEKEIKKIMSKYNCTKEKAEQLYNKQKLQSAKSQIEKGLENSLRSILSSFDLDIVKDVNIKTDDDIINDFFELQKKSIVIDTDDNNNIELTYDDNENTSQDNSNGFWF